MSFEQIVDTIIETDILVIEGGELGVAALRLKPRRTD